MIIALAMVLVMLPVSAFANSDQITAEVNIYVNSKLKTTTTAYDYDDGIWTMEYGSFPFGWLYGDAYGEFKTSEVKVNGYKATCFCFDGENLSFFVIAGGTYKFDFAPEDEIVISLYYTAEEEEAETVYGSLKLNVAYSNGQRAEGEEIVLSGKKGADVQTLTIVSDADGIAQTDELDVSYDWSVLYNGCEYPVMFDDNNSDWFDLMAKMEEPEVEDPLAEPVVVLYTDKQFADEEYTITVSHELKTKAGGTAVDGHVEGATVIEGKKITLHAGEESIFGGDLFDAANGEFEVLERKAANNSILYNGDTYKLTGSYTSGGSSSPAVGSVNDIEFGESFRMIRSDITEIFHYTLEEPVYKVTMNYVDEDGNEVAPTQTMSAIGSTTVNGEKSYDAESHTPGAFPGYQIVEGFTYDRAEGDALTGELDSDKTINFIYTKDAEVIEEPVVEEPVVTEEPEEPVVEEPVVTEEPAAEEPEVTEEPAEEEKNNDQPAGIVNDNNDNIGGPTNGPEDEAEPAAEPEISEITPMIENAEIAEEEVPLAEAPGKAWALVNLISAILTAVIALLMAVSFLRKRNDNNDNSDEDDRRHASKLFGLIPAAASVILFILTENMSNPMALTDRWTPMMVVILLIGAVTALVTRKGSDDDNREENAKAGAAA